MRIHSLEGCLLFSDRIHTRHQIPFVFSKSEAANRSIYIGGGELHRVLLSHVDLRNDNVACLYCLKFRLSPVEINK